MLPVSKQQTLLRKYDIPVPRYTSYPTVPYWQTAPPSAEEWSDSVHASFSRNPEISLYIHLPFCERLCTYCGCNKRITKRHEVEIPYIHSLLKEWQMYLRLLPHRPILREVHLGGGTPTFFHPDNLRYLLQEIQQTTEIPDKTSYSWEGHPGNTTPAHLEALARLGFNRVSIGVQDFDPKILQTINRFQETQQIEDLTREARQLGYQSINYDFVFGLPHQKPEHIQRNMQKVKELRPDRIAFYSYAHVPWSQPGQRAYSEKDLPSPEKKRELYEIGRQELEQMGYAEIGLDHFALPTDDLLWAWHRKSLHRNFMGYTPFRTELMIGLGVSAISDAWGAFVQNEKHLETYQERIERGELPFFKGHLLDQEDLLLRRHILNLMCHLRTHWSPTHDQHPAILAAKQRWQTMEKDGLLILRPNSVQVTDAGRPFIRNISMALDARLWRNQPQAQVFSQAV
ncbi:MAG: oxygen-independent coproporphyrinogen III oxidase [Bernardetiaceae bacterium]